MNTSPQWVDNDKQLATLCACWLQKSAIAIDTEFVRSDTFFPHIGLLQIADNDGVYLIGGNGTYEFQTVCIGL